MIRTMTLPKAWNKIIFEPDELLVELIAVATEKICGYKPDNMVVENFISSNINIGEVYIKVPGVKESIKKPTAVSRGESYIGKSITAFVLSRELTQSVASRVTLLLMLIFS